MQPPTIQVAGEQLFIVDLPNRFGERLQQLPVVLRLLLENVIRNCEGQEREDAVTAILAWLDRGSSEAEIAFQPDRVLMHDTTSTPALVDIAAMRDALAEHGCDPSVLNPCLPVDVSVDHSLAVDAYACDGAAEINLQHELRHNQERYRFMRWAARSLEGVRIHPPGTGIMHTINLEQLATVVRRQQRGGEVWAVPDVMIGTDSHTPMINGIGVLGWGVGGVEALTVMFGMPVMLRIPDVTGVRLTGSLPPSVMATDLALVVTQRLRSIGVSGEFVEFFGSGVRSLRGAERAVLANMALEYGATTGYFPVDQCTLDYLRQTGRDASALELVETYTKRVGLWFDPQAQPRYTRVVEIDLSAVGMHLAGPRRPQDLLDLGQAREIMEAEGFMPSAPHAYMPRHPVAVAAIASCTNTSDPRLLIAAGLVARNARRRGLTMPSWVKTSLSPGSPAATSYLERAGLRGELAAIGFEIVGFGCATCIGNTGALPQEVREAMEAGSIHPVAVLSGNRNFPGRVHPDLDLGFLMSPPLVVAFALAGDAERNLDREPVARDASGRPVFLHELWPSHEQIESHLAQAMDRTDFPRMFAIASHNLAWAELRAPKAPRFPWEDASNALRRPPFAAPDEGSLLGAYAAWPLLVLGDDVTTDHISPASAIPPDSVVAHYLAERGEDRDDLGVFAARRGNWEVMLRGAFHSKSLNNCLAPGAPVAHTLHGPSATLLGLREAALRYRDEGRSVVIVAGERYGTGSSRDWAAKVQRLLGVRAVLAVSFERIHRSNLIGMGILPLRWPTGVHPGAMHWHADDRVVVDAGVEMLAPRCGIPVRVERVDGTSEAFTCLAAVETQLEVDLLRKGGVMPSILGKYIGAH